MLLLIVQGLLLVCREYICMGHSHYLIFWTLYYCFRMNIIYNLALVHLYDFSEGRYESQRSILARNNIQSVLTN